MTLKELHNEMIEMKQSLAVLLSLFQNGSFSPILSPQMACLYSLYQWLDEWYVTYKAPKLKSSSLKSLKICIDNHIKPHITDKNLADVNGLDIQKALNRITSSRMKKYTYDVYSAALKQAQKLKLIRDNPFLSVDSVNHKRKTGNALTLEQQKRLIKILEGHKLKPLYLFYLMTGCRRQEALDIKWTDINFKAKQIHIHGTKTEKSDRFIPLFDCVLELFKTIPKTNEYIFPYSGNLVHCQFARLKEKHKLPYRIHDLRHTFATRCIENGISMKIVQKWLGHAKMDTTANTYTHVLSAFENEEVKKYDPKL